eukprot:309076-Rhodomonas_salina.2
MLRSPLSPIIPYAVHCTRSRYARCPIRHHYTMYSADSAGMVLPGEFATVQGNLPFADANNFIAIRVATDPKLRVDTRTPTVFVGVKVRFPVQSYEKDVWYSRVRRTRSDSVLTYRVGHHEG